MCYISVFFIKGCLTQKLFLANMRFIISILLLLGGVIISSAYTAENCPSTIPEWQRIDCYPESGSTEAGCFNRGCMWCEASVQGPPWCFFDNALPTTQSK